MKRILYATDYSENAIPALKYAFNLSEKLSKDLNCNVIVTIAQSVSDSYYFSVYDK